MSEQSFCHFKGSSTQVASLVIALVSLAAVTAVGPAWAVGEAGRGGSRFHPLSAQGKVELRRLYKEIKRRGSGVSVKRAEKQLTIYEVGFDTIERGRIVIDKDSSLMTILLERGGESTSLTHFYGAKRDRVLDIVDEKHYENFLLGKEAENYFVVSESDPSFYYGPLVKPPQKLEKLWVVEDKNEGKRLLRFDSIDHFKLYPPIFYGEPEALEGSYFVKRDRRGMGHGLISSSDPTEYSLEIRGRPTDDGHFWRAERYIGIALPPGYTMENQGAKFVLINKHNLTQAIGFDEIEDLGWAYRLRMDGQPGAKIVGKSDVTSVAEESPADAKNKTTRRAR